MLASKQIDNHTNGGYKQDQNNYINIVKKENIFLQYRDDKRSI